jgi:hypothetical protein
MVNFTAGAILNAFLAKILKRIIREVRRLHMFLHAMDPLSILRVCHALTSSELISFLDVRLLSSNGQTAPSSRTTACRVLTRW